MKLFMKGFVTYVHVGYIAVMVGLIIGGGILAMVFDQPAWLSLWFVSIFMAAIIP